MKQQFQIRTGGILEVTFSQDPEGCLNLDDVNIIPGPTAPEPATFDEIKKHLQGLEHPYITELCNFITSWQCALRLYQNGDDNSEWWSDLYTLLKEGFKGYENYSVWELENQLRGLIDDLQLPLEQFLKPEEYA